MSPKNMLLPGEEWFIRKTFEEKYAVLESENKKLEETVITLEETLAEQQENISFLQNKGDEALSDLAEVTEERDRLEEELRTFRESRQIYDEDDSYFSAGDLAQTLRKPFDIFPILRLLMTLVNDRGCWCDVAGGVHTPECHTIRSLYALNPMLFEDTGGLTLPISVVDTKTKNW